MRANKNLSYKNTMNNAYTKIQEAKKAKEKFIVSSIKSDGSYYPNRHGLATMATYHAIDRLLEAKKIRYSEKKLGFVLA